MDIFQIFDFKSIGQSYGFLGFLSVSIAGRDFWAGLLTLPARRAAGQEDTHYAHVQ